MSPVNEFEKNWQRIKEFFGKPKTEPWKVLPWEAALLKKLDANNPDDIERYRHIDVDPEALKWMEGDIMTKEEILENFSDEDQLLCGVCGEKSKGKIEGWVQLYDTETERINRLVDGGLADFSKDTQVLEISYARYVDPHLPKENQERGLIPSAVRQICFSVIKDRKNIVITAYTNPKNLLSESVLKNAGFIIRGKIFYDENSPEEDNFWTLDENKLKKILEKKKSKHVKFANR
jgi:hypothetical protein